MTDEMINNSLATIEKSFKDQVGELANKEHLNCDERQKLYSAIDRAAEQYKEAQLETVGDYIISKFNMCNLLSRKHTTNRHEYFPILDALNSVFLSKLYNDSKIEINVFDRLATLNFRSHNYENARLFIKKAIEIEGDNPALSLEDRENVFMRRWHAALCYEYIGLDRLHGLHGQKNDGIHYLTTAIEILIGNFDSFKKRSEENAKKTNVTGTDNDTFCLPKLYDADDISINEIGLNSAPCLAKQVLDWTLPNGSTGEEIALQDSFAEQRKVFLKHIAHTLAHCLSEYVRYESEGRERSKEEGYILRIADNLIKCLGDKYVTCQATLLIEANQYYAALSLLEAARWPVISGLNAAYSQEDLTISEHLSSLPNAALDQLPDALFKYYCNMPEEVRKKLNEVALIEFYRWYYSVFSDSIDKESSEKMFRAYCNYSNDPVAATYYNIIRLKGLLIKGYADIRSRSDKESLDDLLSEIKEAYDALNESRPGPAIHTDIWKEWELLDVAYNAFRIYTESKNDAVLLCHRLYNLLIADGCNRESFEGAKEPSKDSEGPGFFHVTTEFGAFVYHGSSGLLSDLLNQYNTDMKLTAHPASKTEAFLTATGTCDVSNVFIALEKATIEDDLYFMLSVIKSDLGRDSEATHSVYVYSPDVSRELLNEQLALMPASDFNSLYEIEKINDRIIILSDKHLAMQFCLTFSCLEKVLAKLYTPLDSNLISPISDDETYIAQIGNYASVANMTEFLSTEAVSNFESVQSFQQADSVVVSCITSQDSATYDGVRLNLDYLLKHLPEVERLTHFLIIRFDAATTENRGRMAFLNSFDIRSNLSFTGEFLFSDTEIVYDAKTLEDALKGLMVNCPSKKRHHDFRSECNYRTCETKYSKQTVDDRNFNTLRDCLFLKKGMLLPVSANILAYRNKKSTHESIYFLFMFDNGDNNEPIVFTPATCQVLRSEDLYQPSNKWSESRNVISKEPALSELIKRIQPVQPEQKYLFVSFRCNNNTDALCRPVYNDIYNLQRTLKRDTNDTVGVFFDAVHISDRTDEQLKEAINNPRCIGAIVYATPEYFLPFYEDTIKPAAEDYCFKELKLLNDKRNNDTDFFVFPVFFKTQLYIKNGYVSFEDLVVRVIRKLQDIKDENRVVAVKTLLDCNEINSINVHWYQMQYDGKHYCSSNHLENALRKANVDIIKKIE